MDLSEARVCESLRGKVTPDEWEVRVNLAACYRLMDRFGMTDLIYNHISARTPDGHDNFLLNAYGMLYGEVTASSLIKVDLHGNVLQKAEDLPYSVNVAGFVIHSAVHEARPEVQCVIHTHTRAGTAVASLDCGLLPLTQTAMRFDRVAYHEYEGPAFNAGEKGRLVEDLGDRDVMILRNHGLLACGHSIPQAFNIMYWLENACRMQIDAMSCRADLHYPAKEVIAGTARALAGGEITFDNVEETHPDKRKGEAKTGGSYGLLEWPALLRMLDRTDPSYKH